MHRRPLISSPADRACIPLLANASHTTERLLAPTTGVSSDIIAASNRMATKFERSHQHPVWNRSHHDEVFTRSVAELMHS